MDPKEKEVVSGKASFEIAPPPIAAKDIKETVTADVVVLGAGISGLTAALSAAETGVKTILLEKLPGINYRGGWNAAVSSKMQKQAGIEVDKDSLVKTTMESGLYRTNQRVVSLWADNCDQVMDWLIDMAEKEDDIKVVLDPIDMERDWYFHSYPLTHYFMSVVKGDLSLQKNLANMLLKNGKARGVDYRFETPAVQLIREGKGKVTGVIARNSKGDYIRFNAGKAVVLCTGDYASDKQMVEKYCDWRAVKLFDTADAYSDATIAATGVKNGHVNTGDGHKMGMWIGAAIDQPPHCSMFFDRTSVGAPGYPPPVSPSVGEGIVRAFWGVARQPWLHVNINGERFMDEDLPWGYESNQIIQQPGSVSWTVFDAKCEQEFPKFKATCCKNLGAPKYVFRAGSLGKAVQNGILLKASTIEELARKMEVPVDTFKATVERYTEMAKNGKDLDFGKHPDRLTTIEIPPFFACRIGAQLLVTLGGLKINTKLQVLDKDRNPIPGLYAAGNVSGSFYAGEYPTNTPGASHSRAWTFGRLAGLAAAAEKE
jgi:fumarate reductase flavoprotein subunit